MLVLMAKKIKSNILVWQYYLLRGTLVELAFERSCEEGG